jgi:hypothetical protein
MHDGKHHSANHRKQHLRNKRNHQLQSSPPQPTDSQITTAAPRRHGFLKLASASQSAMDASTTGLTLATVLLGGSGLFVIATLFFGTKGGYYDTDQYDGNGTAH